jgi:hypothetical protein
MRQQKIKRHNSLKDLISSMEIEHSHPNFDKYLAVWCSEHQLWCMEDEPIEMEDEVDEQFYKIKLSLDSVRRSKLQLFTTNLVD